MKKQGIHKKDAIWRISQENTLGNFIQNVHATEAPSNHISAISRLVVFKGVNMLSEKRPQPPNMCTNYVSNKNLISTGSKKMLMWVLSMSYNNR